MKIERFEIKDYIHSRKHEKKSRHFRIIRKVSILLYTDCGVIKITVDPSFDTDGRSGGRFIDWLFAHWGSQNERACVLVHDVLFHDFGLSFETANDILRQMIKLIGYSDWRADLVYRGVMSSIARKKFGNNSQEEEQNKKLARLEWLDK